MIFGSVSFSSIFWSSLINIGIVQCFFFFYLLVFLDGIDFCSYKDQIFFSSKVGSKWIINKYLHMNTVD